MTSRRPSRNTGNTTTTTTRTKSKSRNNSTTPREPPGYSMGEIPPFVQYTSPAAIHEHGSQLPLNLIARIVSYLDDPGDIARVTRTSRLLYYMTLPQLYQQVALHSYSDIKYVNGRPEGYGSGSPFMMALNGLVTKSYAGVVQHFRVWGEWKDVGADDFAKGRVPDNSMMLNMMLRVCVDKMVKLRSFSWELDCKPLKTLYQGLAAKDTLTSLTIKFPSSRLPRPSVCIPAMPALKVLKAIDIDPLCYPDDISVLILSSKNLIDLRLHFSPRMRTQAEPSLSMEAYFGRCFKAGYIPQLKHVAMQNFFGPNTHALGAVMNPVSCESCTFLDTFGGAQGGSSNVFVDDTWRHIPNDTKFHCRILRFNEFAEQHVTMIKNSRGLERVYIVNDRAGKPAMSSTGNTPGRDSAEYITPDDSPAASTTTNHTNGTTTVSAPADIYTTARNADISTFGPFYLNAFTQYHGATLQHLLLSAHWKLNETDISTLIRCCPNLTQLGLALASSQISTLRLLLPFLENLYAFRILDFEDAVFPSEQEVIDDVGRNVYRANAEKLMWIGDHDRVFRLGEVYQRPLEGGGWEKTRRVERVEIQAVSHVEIWRLDCLDLMADDGFQ
jgi:hypothetical protein